MIDDELKHWIDQSLNETATQEQSHALEKRLLENPRAREYYLNAVNLHASLQRRFSSEAELPSVIPLPKTGQRNRIIGLAIAACMILFIGLISLWDPPEQAPQPTAIIAQVVGAHNDSGTAYTVGDSVDPGRMQVSRGLLRLDFSNGALVTIEGPADLEILNKMKVVLHRGVVTATISEAATGFVVDTAAAQVLDLGTSFGVSVGDDGLTDVCVFDGEVEVTNQANVDPHLVREGQAVRTSGPANAIDSVAYETSQFENAWPMNSGVLQTTGSMRFVSPGPDFHPGNYEDNEHIIVFPERRDFTSKEAVRVDMLDPGQYARTDYNDKDKLLTEQGLTSYLLQLNAYPSGIHDPNRRRSVRGQITFATPIVGVITEDALLQESEAIFGLPNVTYPTARTIEPRPKGDVRIGFDSLVLAADRRTLIIELQENPGNIDQIRVLVEAE